MLKVQAKWFGLGLDWAGCDVILGRCGQGEKIYYGAIIAIRK